MPDSAHEGESLLFLTDEQLRKGIEAMFFAYRGFTADPDRILAERGLGAGRITGRCISSTGVPGTTVNNLLTILGVTKQSLNRVLRDADRGRSRDKHGRRAGPAGAPPSADRDRRRAGIRN